MFRVLIGSLRNYYYCIAYLLYNFLLALFCLFLYYLFVLFFYCFSSICSYITYFFYSSIAYFLFILYILLLLILLINTLIYCLSLIYTRPCNISYLFDPNQPLNVSLPHWKLSSQFSNFAYFFKSIRINYTKLNRWALPARIIPLRKITHRTNYEINKR